LSSAPDQLRFKEKLAYGLGDTASNFYFQAFNQFLVFYYTDIFGLAPGPVGTLMFIVPLLVAVLNPVVGMLADRTETRWGKFRPYILWGSVPYGVLGVVMFANPNLGTEGKLAYAYVTYALVLIAYAAINTPYSALMGVMSPSSEERTSLSTYRFACAFTGTLLIGWLVPQLKDALAGAAGTPAVGFRNTMALFAVLSVGMFFFTFANTRERVKPLVVRNASPARDLGDLARNRPWMILVIAGLLTMANAGLRSGSGIYYFKYVVRDEAGLGNFNFFGFLAFIVGALSTKLFLRYFPRRGLMITLTILNAVGMGAFYILDPHSLPLLYAMNIFASFVAGPTPAIVWSMYADTADFGEWRFGRRATGLVFSAAVFAQKVGLAIGGALLGKLLGYYGFVANVVQTPRAVHGILVLYAAIPGAFALLSGLSILLYPLDDRKVKSIEQELRTRKPMSDAAPA
jgi:GPH family glycoside/pentoside/hexuronide:cation symporter